MIGTAYFDASGKKENPSLVVAGFVSPTLAWISFERNWNSCLTGYGVSELHMKNFAHSAGEFTSWKDNEVKRRKFLGDLIAVIKNHTDNSFATAVHMEDYRLVNKQYRLKEWAHPYAVAGAHCIGKVKSWAIESGYSFADLDYVFEDGDEGKGDLFRLSSEHLGINPIFKPKSGIVAFQAADLIAYEHYKANLKILEVGDGVVGIEELRVPLQLLASVPGSSKWGVATKQTILDVCRKYGVQLRHAAN